MASNKMPRRLVALSSSAIAAIYFAGLVTTHGADASIGAASAATAVPSIVATSTTTLPSVTPTATATNATSTTTRATAAATATSTSVPSVAPTTTTAATGAYLDGSYTGSGTSRRGSITVTVTVSGGRITNVALTSVNTEYPGSRIASLPAQVVARQSANVDNVSGATYSAQAFRLAVQAALAKATA